METPDVPLNRRGTPRTRFDPLRDAPRAENANLEPHELEILENGLGNGPDDRIFDSNDLIRAVRRQIAALGLSASVEGQIAITAAEKAALAGGSAAAACLHELRMAMTAIQAANPVAEAKDPTEDVLARKRHERKAGA